MPDPVGRAATAEVGLAAGSGVPTVQASRFEPAWSPQAVADVAVPIISWVYQALRARLWGSKWTPIRSLREAGVS